MSELGQTLPKLVFRTMSGFPPSATESRTSQPVCLEPNPDIGLALVDYFIGQR